MRNYTNKVLEMVDDGLIDQGSLVMMAMKYMSDEEVYDMLYINEIDLDKVIDYDEEAL